MLAPPGVPDDRVALLRRALMALDDGQLRAEAEKQRLDLEPLNGARLAQLMNRLYRISPYVVADARKIMGAEGGATPAEERAQRPGVAGWAERRTA